MVSEPPPRPGEPPEWVPVQEKLSPEIPPGMAKPAKPPVRWRWPGDGWPGAIPLPKDLSDATLMRQIGAQLTTTADREDSTAIPPRAESAACTSVADFLDTFFSPGPFDLNPGCCPPPPDEYLVEFEKAKTGLMEACNAAVASLRERERMSGRREISALKEIKAQIDRTREDLEKQYKKAVDEADGDKDKMKNLKSAWEKNIQKFEDHSLRTVIGIIAAGFLRKWVDYVPHGTNRVPYFPGFEHPGMPHGEDPGAKGSTPRTTPRCPNPEHASGEPYSDPLRPQCPEYDSPYVPNTPAGRDFLAGVVQSVIDCVAPNRDWRTDCIRIGTICWFVAGYYLYGGEFLKKYSHDRITFGPFTGQGEGDPREEDDKRVWPLGKEHVGQYGISEDGEGKPYQPEEGDIVWFGETATVCLGTDAWGTTRYLIPIGERVIMLIAPPG